MSSAVWYRSGDSQVLRRVDPGCGRRFVIEMATILELQLMLLNKMNLTEVDLTVLPSASLE